MKGPNGAFQSEYVIAPQTLPNLFQSTMKASDEEICVFLAELINLLEKNQYNVLMMVSRNTPSYLQSQKDFDFVNSIVELIFSSVKKGSEKRKLVRGHCMKILSCVGAKIQFLRQHYEKVYETLSQVMATCIDEGDANKNSEHIFNAIKIISSFANSASASSDPSTYFYFLPASSSLSAIIPPGTPWPFHKV